jgi:hypothetical protein
MTPELPHFYNLSIGAPCMNSLILIQRCNEDKNHTVKIKIVTTRGLVNLFEFFVGTSKIRKEIFMNFVIFLDCFDFRRVRK